MAKEKKEQDDEQVLTPGGRRKREDNHRVGPGEIVVHDELGDRIVPNADLVLTPGGFRDKSLVHIIEPSHALVVEPNKFRKLNLLTKNITDLQDKIVAWDKAPILGSGWISYAYWTNGTGNTCNRFTSSWLVPQPPSKQASPVQTIFLFNGIQNYGANFGILQPVLQWGISAAGGGNYWSIASWYVTSGGQAFHTQLTPINPGMLLIGLMTLTNSAGDAFSYQSEFQGIPGTILPVHNIAELLWFNETLEAYGIQDCSDYPNTPATSFSDIAISAATGPLPVNWTAINKVVDCGQNVSVINPTQVSVAYRAATQT